MKMKGWPVNPFSGEPETERDIIMSLIFRASMPPEFKIRLACALPPEESFPLPKGLPVVGIGSR